MNFFILIAQAFECPGATDANGACVLRSDLLQNGVRDALTIVDTVTNWLFTILLTLAVLFVILAAYKYLMSQGGEEVGKAHKMLLYAAVAVAVAILARGVVNVVKVITGASSSDTSAGQVTTPSGGGAPSAGSTVTNPSTGAPGGALPAGHTGNFFEVSGVTANGAAVKIEVEYCSDGKKPGVMVNGTKYGDNPTIVEAATPSVGKYLLPATGSPSTQRCIDGVIPNVKVNGVLNGSVKTSGSSVTPEDQKIADAFKEQYAAAKKDDYVLKVDAPQIMVPFCPDGKVVAVLLNGTVYSPPDFLVADSTQTNFYRPQSAGITDPEDVGVGNCPTGSPPSPVWIGVIKYIPQ